LQVKRNQNSNKVYIILKSMDELKVLHIKAEVAISLSSCTYKTYIYIDIT